MQTLLVKNKNNPLMLSRKWTCFFIFLCVLSLYQATLAQDSDEDVFAQVFGKKAKPVSVVSPVVLDGIPLGTVDVVAEGENFLIDKKKLIGLVEKKLRPKIVDQIRALSGEKLKVSDLAVPGLKVRYDEDNLALRIDITPEARETNVVSFRGPPSLAKREVIHRPSLISGYLNTRVNRQWDHPDFLDQFVEGPLLVDLEGVVNFNDWVLQAQWDMNSDNQEKWQRKDVRLTRDHPAQATRYSFGDIEYALLGFQNFRALGGFSLAKNYSLQPYLVTSPVGRNKLFLKRRSTVRIFVNGRFLRELELDAGEHDLRDLPLVRGVNEVQVEVEDDLGKKERLIFPFVSEAELLRQGLHQYGYNFGAPFDEIGGDRSYDGSRLTYSFFHRYGLFNSTTVGVYSQGDDRQKLYGTELVWGSSIGLIALDTAMSQVEGFDNDYAARLRYRYLEDSAGSRFAKNFGFNVEYTGQSFGALGTTNPNNSVETAFDISYSQSLS